ncbi:MAG: hypothetical protein DRP81_06460 [Candidatus Omnitrophota bacterium]|nr:MAG: hypothetical protein DRP81_06460 [Candidatus Omnitrophota bacterium]
MYKKLFLSFVILVGFLCFSQVVFSAVTQCDYAVKLAEELNLGKGLSVEEAISALTKVGIVPKEGFKCNVQVTREFLNEIQELVIAAAEKGLIDFSPERAIEMLTSLSEDMDLPPPVPLGAVPPPPPPPSPPVPTSPMK